MRNNTQKLAIFDLFAKNKIRFSTSIKLVRYVFFVCKNRENYNSNKSNDNNVAAKIKVNDNNKNIKKRFLTNLYEFYGVYNS